MATTTMLIHGMLCLSALAAAPTADFYVAPNGDDTAPGTLDAPFATIARAQEAVRGRVAEGLARDVTVLIRGGAHFLDAPLRFTHADGGTPAHKVIYAAYPGETVLVSGGRAVGGWTRADGDRWQTTLDEVKAGAWHFRQLFADGERLPRGRYPNGDGLMRVKAVNEAVTEITLKQTPPAADLAGQDAELVVIQNWSISRGPVVSSDGALMRMAYPMGWIGHRTYTVTSPGKPCYLEHALPFVDAPGEWHLDRTTGVLTYQAAEGEDPNARQFIAPRLERLVVVEGAPGKPVRNLHLVGLDFAHAAWPLPDVGYMGIQAGHHGTSTGAPTYVLPPAIGLLYAEDCAFERCGVRHVGATGLALGAGCRRNLAAGCTIEDAGGNGVMIGWRGDFESAQVGGSGGHSASPNLSADWSNEADVPLENVVVNCTVRRCGAVNYGCVGIYDGFCAKTRIAHNLVTQMPYTGVSVGFRWNMSSTSQRGTQVERNHVHDVMGMLADGGCIYTLGFQPNTVLRGNLLHGVHRSAFAHGGAPNNGIFFDQGSKGYLVQDNIIYDTSGEAIRFNQTDRGQLTWKNNHFDVDPGDPAFPKALAEQAGPQKDYAGR